MWTVLTLGRVFTAPVVARKDEIVAGLTRTPPPSELELERLDRAYDELQRFTAQLIAVVQNNVDPIAGLSNAYERGLGALIPNYMVLSVGRWQAYFRVDPVAQVLLGVLIVETGSGLPANLQMILDHIDGPSGVSR